PTGDPSESYALALHDALPISQIVLDVPDHRVAGAPGARLPVEPAQRIVQPGQQLLAGCGPRRGGDGTRDLRGDQRHDVLAEVEPAVGVLTGPALLIGDMGEIAPTSRATLVVDLGVVGHPTPGAEP